MRIAILADPLDNQQAGVHVFAREMVDALIRSNPGHEIILIREKRDHQLKGAAQIIVPNTRLPIGFASFRLFIIIPLILFFKKADVVIEPAHFGPFNLLSSVKRITIIHDLTPILFPHLHRWHSQFLQKLFLKSILSKTDLIIANSDNTAKDICKTYPYVCNKVKRIYPGVSANFKPENLSGVLDKYAISKPYFLFVGTIEPRKNLMVLLDAYRIFLETSPSDAILVIAGGEGWKSESFRNALGTHPFRDRIICTGFVVASDLPTLYSNATALIYPSIYEGFGFPVVEAIKCGTQVIVADNSSLREAGGNVVNYFNTNDPESLADQMTNIQNDSKSSIRISSLSESHLTKFNWNIFAVEFWKLIVEP